MASETVTISKAEYNRLQEKAALADDALLQLHLSLEDLRAGRVGLFDQRPRK